MGFQLRDYQLDGIQDLRDTLLAGVRHVVMQAPTGAGKTVVAAAIIKMARDKGKRVIFCVPSISLIDQTVERFREHGITGIGVIQADHPLTNMAAPVQVCSIQTLGRRGYKALVGAHLVIFDEVHIQFKLYQTWMNDPEWANIPFVGLTATPWAKGMGKLWQKLIIVRTIGQLIEEGHLTPFRVFATGHPDLSGIRTVQTQYGRDYDQGQLGERMRGPTLVADVVSTWLDKSERRPTIVFAVDRLHAQALTEQFRAHGVRAAYVDAFTSREERTEIGEKLEAGILDVVCNVGVLTTGVDWPFVSCIQLVRPTKSEMLYVQMIGRGLRTCFGKDDCIILDHSDTTQRLGFVTDIHHDDLDDGNKPVKEKSKPLPKECPQCHALRPPSTRVCPNCGFVVEPKNTVFTAQGELQEITRGRKAKVASQEEKEQFFRELIRYADLKGYNQGWAYHSYREKFGHGPSQYFNRSPAPMVSPATASWIKHRDIARAKAREKFHGSDQPNPSGEKMGT